MMIWKTYFKILGHPPPSPPPQSLIRNWESEGLGIWESEVLSSVFVPPPPWLSKTMSISSLTFYKKRRYRSQKEEKKHFSFPYENNIELLWSFAKSGCQFLLVTWLVSRKLQSTSSTSVKLCKLFIFILAWNT